MLDRIAELFIFGFMPLVFGLMAVPDVSMAARRPESGGQAPRLVLVAQTGSAAENDLVGREWLVDWIADAGPVAAPSATLSIDATGKASGKGPCNRYFGTAKIDGASIAFSGIGSTRMACAPAVMTQENALFDALAKAASFRMGDGRLVLLDADGNELVRLSAMA
jgi:putative lipoprotein